MKVAIHTLGCKVNQCDTENMISHLARLGLSFCDFNEKADVYIINTCTVTHVSDKKSMQMISRAKRQNPTAFIAVCGCMTQKELPKNFLADYIFDARKPEEIVKILSKKILTKTANCDAHIKRTRSFIKIQDGCERFCSYCIVPYVRGPNMSRKKNEIIDEIKNLIYNGTQEVVLTGINVSSYNDDGGFTGLLHDLLCVPGLIRLRLSSIDPTAIDDEFLALAAKYDNLCPHFHLSMQSGSNRVLKKMNRKYTAEGYFSIVESLRSIHPNAGITTDVIVGFPGESEKCFLDTYSLSQAVGFSDMHIFEYSKREGTPAALLDGQILSEVKKQRSKKLKILANQLKVSFLKKQVGKTLQVLFETAREPGIFNGFSKEYARALVYSDESLKNKIKNVKITGIFEDMLEGCVT